ncbi:unnamed protein product [Prorocentrum cordatum]|uniref:Calmodulin n=1 Tax=Prorocentrum cordatum TaxID=2364126 RepID=A0ABN9SRL9_9DINO|nr:unnamed protein product [Polarella glacialis]
MQMRVKEPEIGTYFNQLGVDPDQLSKFFRLLDSDKCGTTNSEEFVFGCLTLHSEAKRTDVAVLKEFMWMHEAPEILIKQLRHSTFSSCFPSCLTPPARIEVEGGGRPQSAWRA